MDSEIFIKKLINSGLFTLIAQNVEDAETQAIIIKYLKKCKANTGVKIISLVGGAASGKSTLASNLADTLGNADIIGTDDFLLGSRSYRRTYLNGQNPLEKYSFYLLCEKVETIKGLMENQVESVPTYDEESGDAIKIDYDELNGDIYSLEKDGYEKKIGMVDYLFIEGDFLPFKESDFCLYLHLSDDERLKNRISRDNKLRGAPDINQIITNFNLRQKTQHEPYTLPNASKSDMLLIVAPIIVEEETKYTYSIYVNRKILSS